MATSLYLNLKTNIMKNKQKTIAILEFLLIGFIAFFMIAILIEAILKHN